MILLEPSNILPKGEWKNDMFFKVTDPTHGGWFCFNLEVRMYGITRVYEDIKDDSTRMRRLWHRLAGPWRRWQCRRASEAN